MGEIHSKKLEGRVLSGFIKYPDLILDVDSFLSEKDFYIDEHKAIFSVVRNAVVGGEKNVDHILIARQIENLGIGGFANINIYDYVRSIKDKAITKDGALKACGELSKTRVCRELDLTLAEAKEYIRNNLNSPVDEILSSCDSIYNSRMDSYTFSNDPKNLMEDMEDFIEELGNNPQEQNGYPTPFDEWNRLYGGLMPKNIYAIVSRPGHGKSTWIQNMCLKATMKSDVKTLVCDTEMTSEENQFRLLASFSKVPLWYIQTGKWRENEEMTVKVREALKIVKNHRYDHIHVANEPIDRVCSVIRRWYYSNVGRGGKAIVALDYVKLTGEKVGQNWAEHQAIGEKINKLKNLAEDLNIVIITAMQLNRQGESHNRSANALVDDASAISLSDRLQWFASFVGIFRRKTLDELAMDGQEFGTHKLIPLKSRWQGREAAGHQDMFQRREDPNNASSDLIWVNNFLNFEVDNFDVVERGSLREIIDQENGVVSVEDFNPNDDIDTL